jgi:hypothetical protein
MSEDRIRRYQELRQEVTEIAEVLLRENPSGTRMTEVCEEALSLHRVRYEIECGEPLGPDRRESHPMNLRRA